MTGQSRDRHTGPNSLTALRLRLTIQAGQLWLCPAV